MAFDPNDPQTEYLFQAWSDLLLLPPPILVELLEIKAQGLSRAIISSNKTSSFIRNFQKNCKNQDFVNKFPIRVPHDKVIFVSANNKAPYIHKKPRNFMFNGVWIEANDWVDILKRVCNMVAHENPRQLNLLQRIKSRKTQQYFAFDKPESLTKPYPLYDTKIYVETCLSANNIVSLCESVCKMFGYPDMEFEYE